MGLKERTSQILLVFAIIQVVLFSTSNAAPKKASQPFEVQLFSKLVDANSGKNIFYSPLSLKMCLAMIRQGASGETGEQIDAALNAYGQEPSKLADEFHNILEKYRNDKILKIASKIYVMSGYKAQRSFYASLTQKFFSSMASLNFNRNNASANAINRWVKNQSGITNLISPDQLSGDTRIVVVNALKLKGEWASRFNPNDTRVAPFVLEDGTKFDVEMMSRMGKYNLAIVRKIGAFVLEMPYKDSNFSMMIVLPRGKTTLSAVEEKLKSIKWSEVESDFSPGGVEVKIPKFKLEFKGEFVDHLKEMGVQRIFSDDAQFEKMLSVGGQAVDRLGVSKIVQKAFIEVDEGGSTAGAATGAEFMDRTTPIPFIANRPFYFFIKDENNNKIFEGRINKQFTS